MLSTPVVLQYLIAAACTTAEGTLLLVYAPYLDGYGYALPTIGTLSALFNVFRLASRVPVGAAYRPRRARRQLVLWLLLFTAATSGFAVAGGSLPLVVLLTVVHGFAFGALGTINLAVVIDATEGRRAGVSMGLYTAALSGGYALGAFAGGALSDAVGIPAAVAIIGALPALAVPLVLARPPLAAQPHPLEHGPGLGGLWRAHRDLDARVWLAFVIVMYINLVSDAVDTFFALYGLAIGLPLAATGALKGIKSGAATFIRFISAGVFRFVDHRAVNFWGVILMGVATFTIPFFGSFAALAAVFFVAGVCRGLLRVTSAAMVAELRAEGRNVGVASGVYNAGLDIGGIIGPVLAGVVGNAIGLAPMFQVLAAGSVLAYLAVALSSARSRGALGLGDPRVRPAG
ncbi:MAG: MFS transporter [Actinobacteria bacterium]|nr:MFS transporter [Actinomycetota bacterium]